MPVLPTAIDITRAPARPSAAVAQYNPGAVEEATARLGHTITRTADAVVDIQHRIAKLHAQDALLDLKRAHNELTYGENGYARLQNGAAAAPGVYKKYEDLHRAAASKFAEKLNPLARQYFEVEAKDLGDNFQAGFLRHAMSEEIKHRGAVFKSSIDVSAQTAALNYNNPEVLAREKTSRDKLLANYFAENIPGNDEGDQKLRLSIMHSVHGEAHEAVVRAMLLNDKVQDAKEYLTANKDEMSSDRFQALQGAMKSEVEADEARDIATEMYNMRVKGASEIQIQQRKLELTKGKSSTTSNFVDNVYGDLVRARETDERRAVGSLLLEAANGGLSPKDPRLLDLRIKNPALALQVQNAMNKQAGGKGSGSKMTDMALYADIADKIRTGEAVDANDIYGYAGGGLSNADAEKLVGMLEKRNTAAGKFKISSVLIKANKPKSASGNKDRDAAYAGFVESQLAEWKEQNPGKIPTRQEQVEIVQSASEEYVAVDKGWFSRDVTEEAYRMDDFSKAYPKRYDGILKGWDPELKASAFAAYKKFRAQYPTSKRTEAEFLVEYEKRIKGGE